VTRAQWVALVVGVLAVGWAAPLIRLAEAPAIVIAALRLSIAAPVTLGAAVALRREEIRAITHREALLILVAGVVLALHFAAWVAALQRTSVVAGVVLVTTQPLFVGLAAWPLLRERPSRQLVLAIAVAGLGALLLASDDLGDRGSLGGDLLALLGAVFAAAYLIAGRRLREARSTLVYAGLVYAMAAVALLAMLVASGEPVRGHPREAYVYIVLLALVPQLIGHTAFNWALGSLTAGVVAIAILGEPVVATLIAAVLLDETPSAVQLLGGAVVLAGVYLGLRRPAEA
jgi:drug/metabolite transporter (DMT)-like permease